MKEEDISQCLGEAAYHFSLTTQWIARVVLYCLIQFLNHIGNNMHNGSKKSEPLLNGSIGEVDGGDAQLLTVFLIAESGFSGCYFYTALYQLWEKWEICASYLELT